MDALETHRAPTRLDGDGSKTLLALSDLDVTEGTMGRGLERHAGRRRSSSLWSAEISAEMLRDEEEDERSSLWSAET